MSFPLSKLSLVSLNNEAVAMILTGRYDEAVKSFSSAIRRIAALQESRSTSYVFDDCSVEVCCVDDVDLASVPILPGGDDLVAINPTAFHGGLDSVSVYQLPVFVSDENQDCDDCDHSYCSQCPSGDSSATARHGMGGSREDRSHQSRRSLRQFTKARIDFILFFNFALSFHLLGLSVPQQESTTQHLRCAIHWYTQAYWVLMSNAQSPPVARSMVILNNIGQIYQQLGDERSATACFEGLLSAMLILHRNGNSSNIQHWDSFVSNLWCGLFENAPLSQYNAPAA